MGRLGMNSSAAARKHQSQLMRQHAQILVYAQPQIKFGIHQHVNVIVLLSYMYLNKNP